MHFPVHIRLGETEISLHFVLELLGFFLGYRYYLRLRSKSLDKINSQNRIWILVGAAAGAFLFSRVLGALEDPRSWLGEEYALVRAFHNRTIVGGLLGGLAGVEVIKKFIGEKNSSGDLFTYPIILAMIIGRVGCFLSGLEDNTYGVATTLPWGMDLGDGVRRHATNLYEMVFLAALWVALMMLERKVQLKDGARFKLFMVAYLLFRLLVDFIKPYPAFLLGLSSIQLACVAGLVYYYKVVVTPRGLLKKIR